MAVFYDEKERIFKIDTESTTYLIGITPSGYAGHVYYGRRLRRPGGLQLLKLGGMPYEPKYVKREKVQFSETFPFEYPAGGTGDFRESCLEVLDAGGRRGCELFYDSHRILEGKPSLPGLPSSFAGEEDVQTLELNLKDPVLGLAVTLCYTAFEKEDIITRSVRIRNESKERRTILKAYSACLDMDDRGFEMITLNGSWARERHIERRKLCLGQQGVSSIQGKTSHQEQAFLALVTPETNQTVGEVYAMHFVYSGNFRALADKSQYGSVRLAMGINEEGFSWVLDPGEEFVCPECVLTYSDRGLDKMTHSLHDFYRGHLIRSRWLHRERPILINNWEATYFDFTTEKLLSIAREAKKAGIEMLVMDDGWFGKRNSDNCSLGDWKVNKEKLPEGIGYLAEEIHKIGLKFGIWFEPEMVSPDSDLYRAHPDWAIQIPGREPSQSREQYVLDLSRKEIRDYCYESVASILRSARIDYVKWDMNRSLTDIGSSALAPERQGELFHRYVLGLYELQEKLVTEFPDLLLENCSGGGARFDPGMLYYSPQIWCSDDMDPIERLRIQEGTELIYPLSSMGAHVCSAPNHTTGRSVPFETRGHIALSGTFGYELDITAIPEEDRKQIPGQTELYHRYHRLIAEGDYFRIHSWNSEEPWDLWGVVSKDKKEALFTYVQVLAMPNQKNRIFRLRGLDPEALYKIETSDGMDGAGNDRNAEKIFGTRDVFPGDELMECGIAAVPLMGDFHSRLYYLSKL